MFAKPAFRSAALAIVATALLLPSGCVSLGADSYEEFRGAVNAGAPCRELLDIRGNIESAAERERADDDLQEIGCDSADSERDDV
jgi:hypothetical protein